MIGVIPAHHRIIPVITGQERRHDMRTMKRFGRIFLNTLTAISLLLAIATAALWARSGYIVDCLSRHAFLDDGWESKSQIVLSHGTLLFTTIKLESNSIVLDARPPQGFRNEGYVSQAITDRTALGKALPNDWWLTQYSEDAFIGGRQFRVRRIEIPLWLPLIACLLLPGFVSARSFRRRFLLVNAGHCPACGYDMRANPAKCSECGHEPKPMTT